MKKNTSLRLAAAGLALTAALSGAGVAASAETAPAPTVTAAQEKHDLTAYLTVSSAKAVGYAGTVAVRVKNVGAERYYGDFPVISFRVDVKTASGPQGVDRLITPGWFNGAYTRDLGFNEATSTRSFLVTLANPVKVGEDQLVATLNFGDGLTSEGRLANYVTVTQVGRLATDSSTANDQNLDSRQVTKDDFGRAHKGLF